MLKQSLYPDSDRNHNKFQSSIVLFPLSSFPKKKSSRADCHFLSYAVRQTDKRRQNISLLIGLINWTYSKIE